MTNAQQGVEQQTTGGNATAKLPSPPNWYWSVRGMAQDKSATSKSTVAGVDRAAKQMLPRLDMMAQGLGITPGVPQQRLLFYYNKPDTYQEAVARVQQGQLKAPYSWESQQAYFPRDYQADWSEFQKLRERARKGDFGPLMQAQDIAYVSPQPLTGPPPTGVVSPGALPPTSGDYTGPPEPDVQVATPPLATKISQVIST